MDTNNDNGTSMGTNNNNNGMNKHKMLGMVLVAVLVIVALVLVYFQFIADSSDENETTTDTAEEQEASVVDELDEYFQWCATTVPAVIQDVVIGVVSETKTVEEAQEETRTLFASVSPPEEISVFHTTNEEFLVLILPGYIGAGERADAEDSQDFETLIFNVLDADSQEKIREIVEEGRIAYDALPDATKTAAQVAGCPLFEDPFTDTTS